MTAFEIINFYRFVALDAEALDALEAKLRRAAAASGIGGTVLIAPEGVNAALGGLPDQIAAFLAAIVDDDDRFAGVDIKRSWGDRIPFRRFLVRRKRWIIRFAEGQDPKPDAINSAPRLTPAEVNAMLRDRPENLIFVDTRNRYEVDFGTFASAATLPIDRFSDFPIAFDRAYGNDRDKTFVFFCTGGVRCEKVVPWAKERGYDNSFQLDGGILAYFRDFGGEHWDGKCFVFDQRWIVDPRLVEAEDDVSAPRHQPKPAPGEPQPARDKTYLS